MSTPLGDLSGLAAVIDPMIAEPARSRVLAAWDAVGLDAADLMAAKEHDAVLRAAEVHAWLRDADQGAPHPLSTSDHVDALCAEMVERIAHSPCAASPLVDVLTRAISDPGAYLPRDVDEDGNRESTARWGARAVMHLIQCPMSDGPPIPSTAATEEPPEHG